METLKSIRDQVLSLLDESGDTGTTKTIADNVINQAHQNRLTLFDWDFMLWPTVQTQTLTAGTQEYALHQEFNRPYYFYNRGTEAYLIEVADRGLEWDSFYKTSTTRAETFKISGRSQVQNQPTSASVITIVSSSASDNSSTYNVTVRGDTANGVTTETITPSGTSSVAGTTQFTSIIGVTKAAAWNGTMTMTSNAAAVTVLKLFATEYGRSYPKLYLLESPSQADVIEYRFYRNPTTLSNDYDVPDIPPPFQQILVWDTMLIFAGYNSDIDTKAVSIWREMRDKVEEAMMNALAQGQSINAQPRTIRAGYEEYMRPRVYTS